MNRLINSVCFRVPSITKKEKLGNYSVKIQSETHITQYMKVHSEKQKTWYMKVIWKIQYKFPDVKIDLRDGTRPDSYVTALEHFIS